MGTNFQVGYSKLSKIICISGAVFFLASLIYVVSEWNLESDFRRLIVVGPASLIFFIYFVLSFFRYQLTITELYVELRDIRTRKIDFSNIKSASVYDDHVNLKSDHTRILVSSSISNRKQVLEEIYSRINKRPDIHISGDKKVIEKYFGIREE